MSSALVDILLKNRDILSEFLRASPLVDFLTFEKSIVLFYALSQFVAEPMGRTRTLMCNSVGLRFRPTKPWLVATFSETASNGDNLKPKFHERF